MRLPRYVKRFEEFTDSLGDAKGGPVRSSILEHFNFTSRRKEEIYQLELVSEKQRIINQKIKR